MEYGPRSTKKCLVRTIRSSLVLFRCALKEKLRFRWAAPWIVCHVTEDNANNMQGCPLGWILTWALPPLLSMNHMHQLSKTTKYWLMSDTHETEHLHLPTSWWNHLSVKMVGYVVVLYNGKSSHIYDVSLYSCTTFHLMSITPNCPINIFWSSSYLYVQITGWDPEDMAYMWILMIYTVMVTWIDSSQVGLYFYPRLYTVSILVSLCTSIPLPTSLLSDSEGLNLSKHEHENNLIELPIGISPI